jgi:hypothetical protein
MRRLFNWVAVTIAALVVLGVVAIVVSLWIGIDSSEISLRGWLAMGLGVIVTLALGIGLMTLVFVSSRRGYDEFDRRDR